MKNGQEKIKGVVFNIQRYSIHDGPGIRTTVFLKGCPLRCFWCQNPESQKKEQEILIFSDNCTRCGQCVEVCKRGASSLAAKSSIIDRNKCTGCGECVKVCFNGARKLAGATMNVDEVMEEVLKDVVFYQNSGGGITLSGGDPIAQPRYALEILRQSKKAGLHTVLDTCGYAGWQIMKDFLEYTDLVLFDIKQLNEEKHRRGTEVTNTIILDNAKRIARLKPMRVRIPLIPGFNDSIEEIREITHFVRAELGPLEIDLHPYNNLGEVKYGQLGRTCVQHDVQEDEYIQVLREIVDSENLPH